MVEDTDYGSTAIIAALEDRVGQRHETPHQVQSLDRITFSHCIDDGAALDVPAAVWSYKLTEADPVPPMPTRTGISFLSVASVTL